MRVAENRKPEGLELVGEGGEEGERRDEEVEEEEPQRTAVGVGYQTASHC